MVGLTVAKRHDLIVAAEAIGLVHRPRPEAAGRSGDPQILVDTSAIIDGRIADIAESGFLYGMLVVPRFVLDEVQRIADSPDTLRRTRGRRGLEILARMRKEGATPVVVVEDDAPEVAEVDSKLVALAKRDGRAVLTNDLNLNRIADLQGVRVLNVNSLANAVKPALLPGRGAAGPRDPARQGRRPGRRLPRRRDDGRGRGRRQVHRRRGRRHRDPRAPDGRRSDGLRPAAAGLTGGRIPGVAAASVGAVVADAVVVAAGESTRMGGIDKLAALLGGRPLLAWSLDAIAAARRRSSGSCSS